MLRTSRYLFLLLIVAVAPALAQSTDDANPWQDDWKCGQPVPLTPRLKNSLKFGDVSRSAFGYTGGGELPPFLIAGFNNVDDGAILLVQDHGAWKAFPLQEGGDAFAVYISPDHASAVIFAMWTREDPGQDYTVLSTTDGFRTCSCALLPRPRSLYNTLHVGDYMYIEDFNADAAGRATLIGSIDFTEDEVPGSVRWYRTSTRRLGTGWRTPQRIAAHPKPLPGVYTKAEEQNLQPLIDSLRAAP